MAREEADAGQEGGEAQRVGRVRGLLLPGLKRWRIRRGLTQQQLADRVARACSTSRGSSRVGVATGRWRKRWPRRWAWT